MAETHHIFLVPGFFGFVNFGRLIYFSHVREILEDELGQRGLRLEIHRVEVAPTASLRQRAAMLAEQMAERASRGPIHLIGHSTGGLDARLVVAPGAVLGEQPLEDLARRVRTVVTLATPHHGTPLASFFTGLLGQKLLALLSLATVTILREGRLPLSVLARLGAALARLGVAGGTTEALLDHLQDELVGRVPAGERGPLGEFLREIGRDQSLLPQLTPEGIDLFNATAAVRPGLRYGAVVAQAPRPRLGGHLRAGLDLNAQATYALYRFLHRQSGAGARRTAAELDAEQRGALLRGLGALPRPDDSDGVVPTLSQAWGPVIHAARADHLDVIGHFDDPRHEPPHHDWLVTGSRFDRAGFEALWRAIADFIADGKRRPWWR